MKHPHLNRIGSAERKDGMGERFQEDEDGGSLHGSSNLQEIQRLTQKFAAGEMWMSLVCAHNMVVSWSLPGSLCWY